MTLLWPHSPRRGVTPRRGKTLNTIMKIIELIRGLREDADMETQPVRPDPSTPYTASTGVVELPQNPPGTTMRGISPTVGPHPTQYDNSQSIEFHNGQYGLTPGPGRPDPSTPYTGIGSATERPDPSTPYTGIGPTGRGLVGGVPPSVAPAVQPTGGRGLRTGVPPSRRSR